MMQPTESSGPKPVEALAEFVAKLNRALQEWPDKSWHYSRISLHVCALGDIDGQYALWPVILDIGTTRDKSDFSTTEEEVAWGDRHAGELGIMEIVSLRVNKALLETASGQFSTDKRPVIRITRKEQLVQQGITHAVWYRVCEVGGEDFENR